MKPLILIIEKFQNELWGRVHVGDDLLTDSAPTIEGLEKKMKKLLKELHGIDPDSLIFEHRYDLTALFERFNYLKITAIAARSELNPTLLRQYVIGKKHPSAKQAQKIQDAIQKIGQELSKVAVYAA